MGKSLKEWAALIKKLWKELGNVSKGGRMEWINPSIHLELYLVSIHNLAPHPKNRDIEDAIKDDIERLAEEEASQSDPHNLSQGSSRDE